MKVILFITVAVQNCLNSLMMVSVVVLVMLVLLLMLSCGVVCGGVGVAEVGDLFLVGWC